MRADSRYETLAVEMGKSGEGRVREGINMKVAAELSLESP